jgi:recombination protein RecA
MFTGKSLGISREGDIVDLGVETAILKKMGAFFSYGDLRLGQGREAAKEYLRQNAELAVEIEQRIRDAAGGHAATAAPSEEEGEP